MKILFCISRSDTIGGAHVHVMQMAQWLQEQGHTVTVITGGQGVYCEELEKRGLRWRAAQHLRRDIHPLHDLAAIRELRRLIQDEAPDLVSFHSAKAGLLGRLACIRLDVAVLFTAHGWSFTDGIPRRRAFLYRNLERLAAPLADRIITVSEFDKQLALRHGVGRDDQLISVQNAMPDNDLRSDPGADADPVVISCVARLDDQKDHNTLFQALAKLETSRWTVNLIGDGPLEGRLRSQAAELGIDQRLQFLGLRRDVKDLLASSHLFVLPSHWEGLPRSIIEAIRSGLPVIASDVGGTRELIADGESGFLVPAENWRVMRGCLEELVNEPEKRASMGRLARARYEETFQFERMAAATLAIYQSMVEPSVPDDD